MKRFTLLAAVALAVLCTSTTAALAVPVTTSFTARVQNGSGPVTGLVTLNFKIFDAASSGTMVWEETHSSVSADAGLVYVELGSVNPSTNGLDETVFTGGNMWLEITIDGATQSPRLPIGSVPYAVHAATADTLGDLAPSDVALSTHTHDSDYAPLSHSHSAADITTGTLSTNRYDAYNDLSVSSRLDGGQSTDVLLRSVGDSRYATSGHGHSLTCTTVSTSDTWTGPGGKTLYAQCGGGYTVTGGGCFLPNQLDNIYLTRPSSSERWQCTAYTTGSGTHTLYSYARCCRL
jgi:hypothetical protein